MRIRKWIQCAAFMLTVMILFNGGINRVFAMDFIDAGQIGEQYEEAVAYMTEEGVLSGFPDGSFRPFDTLTREQGAKIVVYMLLGEEDADKLTCDRDLYDDVAADRWSAPCIGWCTDRGILNGYGDGKFGPADELTGMQFAKMLLCAFHWEADGRYTGSFWSDAVQEDGMLYGLFAGDEEMCSHAPLQRRQAALMAYNAEHEQRVDFVSAVQETDQNSDEQNTSMSIVEIDPVPAAAERDDESQIVEREPVRIIEKPENNERAKEEEESEPVNNEQNEGENPNDDMSQWSIMPGILDPFEGELD